MALINLKSNLSWYGKTSPGPYKPNTSVSDTKFSNNNIPGVTVTGYSPAGNNASFRQIAAADSFLIDDVSKSQRGFSSREGQGGSGFPFLKDFGWHTGARYNNSVKRLDWKDDNAQLKSGIAYKYTSTSFIDDQYNKFKVREESWNLTSYAQEPFILRGIQRDGKTKNQRYGLNFDDGLIRGGVTTAATRIALDALRIGKWLIKPKGIMWMVKQFGMQMTNPNTESIFGTAAAPFANSKKIFTPINLLANVVGAPLGLRFQRHGILPLPTTSRYEDITGKLRPTTSAKKENNRLNKLLSELQPNTVGGALPASAGILSKIQKLANKLGFAGQGIKTLSGMTGPGSVYGLGSTQIRRVVDTSFRAQMAGRDKGLDGFGLGTTNDFWFHDKETPYFVNPLTVQTEDEVRSSALDSLKQKYFAKGIKAIAPYFGALSSAGNVWTTLQFVTPSIISSIDQEDKISNNFTGDPFNLRSIYETSTFPLTGIKSQIVLTKTSVTETKGAMAGRKTKNYDLFILDYTTGPDARYYGKTGDGSKKMVTAEEPTWREKGTQLKSSWITANTTDFKNPGGGYHMTGLEAQVANQGGIIKGLGDKNEIIRRYNFQHDAYYMDNLGVATSVPIGLKGAALSEKETELRIDKFRGKSLTDITQFWSKGTGWEGTGVSGVSTRAYKSTNVAVATNVSSDPISPTNIKAVQHYAAMSYGQLTDAAKIRSEGTELFHDFRATILTDKKDAKTFIGNVVDNTGKLSSYAAENRETIYKEPAIGTPGRDRSMRLAKNLPDPINNAEVGDSAESLKDFINFKFYRIGMGNTLASAKKTIAFRAFIDSISDSISPSWGEYNDQGRADPKIMLESWNRSISLSFKVAAFSGAELKVLYDKMEELANCAYPNYTGTAGFTGEYIKIWIGDLYKNQPCYITGLTFDWDNETPWELDEGLQVPYYTNVSLELGWIGDYRPDSNQKKSRAFSIAEGSAYKGPKFLTT